MFKIIFTLIVATSNTHVTLEVKGTGGLPECNKAAKYIQQKFEKLDYAVTYECVKID